MTDVAPTPNEISEGVLDLIRTKWGNDPDVETVRLGLGLTMSAIHSAMLGGSRGEEDQLEAVRVCLDTLGRLTDCLARDIDRFEIKGVTIQQIEVDDMGEPYPEHETDRGLH